MVRKPVVLITGASGEIGHGLIERLAQDGSRPIITLDLRPLDPPQAARVQQQYAGSILDDNAARTDPVRVRGRAGVPPGRAAVDARRVHADHRAPRQRRGHDPAARVRPEGRRVARAAGGVPVPELDRGLRPARPRDQGARGHASPRTSGTRPPRCTAATSCTASTSGATTRATTSSSRPRTLSGKVDFRSVRFPGLISAVTVPSGGTSDYAPEMLHAAAQGQPYACFVRPDTRIPFMAMPDGVEALLRLAAAPKPKPAAAASTTWAPSTLLPTRSAHASPPPSRAPRSRSRSTRSASASWTTGRPTSTTPRRAATGASLRATTKRAPSASI